LDPGPLYRHPAGPAGPLGFDRYGPAFWTPKPRVPPGGFACPPFLFPAGQIEQTFPQVIPTPRYPPPPPPQNTPAPYLSAGGPPRRFPPRPPGWGVPIVFFVCGGPRVGSNPPFKPGGGPPRPPPGSCPFPRESLPPTGTFFFFPPGGSYRPPLNPPEVFSPLGWAGTPPTLLCF